jgi:DNA helicase-2/ATP-dependent DNA helicase PcrA
MLKVDWKFKPKAFSNLLKPEGALRIKSFRGHMTTVRNFKKKWVAFDQYAEAYRIVLSEFPIKNNSTAAILVRKNSDADMYADIFKEERPDVNLFKVSGVDLFSRRITKDMLSVLNIFTNNRDKLSWSRIFHMCTGQSLKQSRSIINSLFNAGITPIDILFSNTFKDSLLDDFLNVHNSARIVVFDTETTGLDVKEDDIIQIAAIEIIEGVPGKVFEVYIDTNRDFQEAEKIHHISKQYLVNNAIKKHSALSNFIDFVDNSTLIAHNLEYDYKILNSNLEKTGLPSISQYIKLYDSVDIAQRLYPNLPRYKLEYLLKAFNIEGENSHNAIDDVKATVGLIKHCVSDIELTKSSRKNYLNSETSKLLEKFSKNFLPLYKLLSTNSKISNIGDIVLNTVSHIDHNFNSKSQKYKDNAHIELKKLIKHMRSTCEEEGVIGSIKKYIPNYSKYKEVDLKLESDNVVVATVHKAKGLEFDYVIIPQCVMNNYPGYYSIRKYSNDNDDSGILEDARLLYVAMTRAKKKLLITYSSDTYNKGGYFDQKPSWFLHSIKELFSEETIE